MSNLSMTSDVKSISTFRFAHIEIFLKSQKGSLMLLKSKMIFI